MRGNPSAPIEETEPPTWEYADAFGSPGEDFAKRLADAIEYGDVGFAAAPLPSIEQQPPDAVGVTRAGEAGFWITAQDGTIVNLEGVSRIYARQSWSGSGAVVSWETIAVSYGEHVVIFTGEQDAAKQLPGALLDLVYDEEARIA